MPVNNALTPEGSNALGAAFGYYPQLRRNRQFNDPSASAEMPLQFLRGRLAGTVGLPSDILNMFRSPMPMEMYGQTDYAPQQQVPYGSQELMQTLPLAPTSPAGQLAGNVGAVMPLSPAEILQAARVARQTALAGGKVGKSLAKHAGEEFNATLLGERPNTMLGAITPQPKFIFVGENSKTWDKVDAVRAQALEKKGATPEHIWQETGTFRGPEGKWRQEISDQPSKLTLGQHEPDVYGAIEKKTFEGALEHPELQRAYPELNDISFQHWPKEEFRGAYYDSNANQVVMGQEAMKPELGVGLHELQHAIQLKEGFAKGGSPTTVLNDWYEGINKELSSLVKQMDILPEYERKFDKTKEAQYQGLRSKYDELMNQKLYNAPDAEDAYNRLAGEAEARAVQERLNMTDAERRAKFPYESYDVPVNQLIVRNVSPSVANSEVSYAVPPSGKQSFQYPQQEALRLAQERASLPVEQGGLGLPKDNTPQMRAQAMGFDLNNPQYHATDVDFSSIRPSIQGKLGAGVYVSPSSPYAEKYTSLNAAGNARVLPLVARGKLADDDVAMNIAESIRQEMFAQNPNFSVSEWKKRTTQALTDAGYDGRSMSGLENVITNPSNLRSRFAAFDPFRKDVATATAMGVLAPDLLASQQDPYSQNEMRKFMRQGR